ncbi:hypothetical protein ROS1_60480 [Roseibium sp. ROS1]|jgi:hypothetical protein|uniref:hypothetical protein n=1 Tax=Roseibium aggregatum TaxID=187304 RepID=UPI001E2B950A|nr:hypothetical protein [Roseibium aggregatum]
MTTISQKRLAIALAAIATAVFVGANAHMLVVAFKSQPACTAAAGAAPARHSC